MNRISAAGEGTGEGLEPLGVGVTGLLFLGLGSSSGLFDLFEVFLLSIFLRSSFLPGRKFGCLNSKCLGFCPVGSSTLWNPYMFNCLSCDS